MNVESAKYITIYRYMCKSMNYDFLWFIENSYFTFIQYKTSKFMNHRFAIKKRERTTENKTVKESMNYTFLWFIDLLLQNLLFGGNKNEF